jgi:hypothetical protein
LSNDGPFQGPSGWKIGSKKQSLFFSSLREQVEECIISGENHFTLEENHLLSFVQRVDKKLPEHSEE